VWKAHIASERCIIIGKRENAALIEKIPRKSLCDKQRKVVRIEDGKAQDGDRVQDSKRGQKTEKYDTRIIRITQSGTRSEKPPISPLGQSYPSQLKAYTQKVQGAHLSIFALGKPNSPSPFIPRSSSTCSLAPSPRLRAELILVEYFL
jgi:hypothetical protein